MFEIAEVLIFLGLQWGGASRRASRPASRRVASHLASRISHLDLSSLSLLFHFASPIFHLAVSDL